jgi:glycosyltransferase involved in cell wall biosynthesis
MLDYAVVVATRNRQDILRTSLETFAGQTRPPARIIVIDRSDDHDAIRDIVASMAAESPVPFEVHYGDAANLPLQRNQGIALVSEAITMFPDDDVLWYPDTAAAVMKVYEADTNARYGAVSAIDSYQPPVPLGDGAPERRTRLTDRPSVMAVRNLFEAAVVPQPFEVYGRSRTRQLEPSARADGLAEKLVGTIGGYRMTFRTEIARRLGFDPVLGSRVGYGVHEDKDMALRVLSSGSLIAVAESARAFHNVHPGKRTSGFSYGFFHIFNYAYVCHKIFPRDSHARRTVNRYLRYKLALYRLRRGDQYARDVYDGAAAALDDVAELFAASPGDLPEVYRLICARRFGPDPTIRSATERAS